MDSETYVTFTGAMGLNLKPGGDSAKAVCTSGCLNASTGYAITTAATCQDPPYAPDLEVMTTQVLVQ